MKPAALFSVTVPALGVAAFVAGRRSAMATARRMAATDPLTGLPNRAGLHQELRRRAAGRQPYALLLADLDGFKAINDSHGHAAGDAVLTAVAGRLAELVDGHGMAARLGGDEFVLVAEAEAPVMATLLGRDVVRAVTRPVDVAGHRLEVGASVGVAHALPGDDPRELLHAADVAMYRAKVDGGGVAEHDDTVPLVVDEHPVVRLRDLTAAGRDLTTR